MRGRITIAYSFVVFLFILFGNLLVFPAFAQNPGGSQSDVFGGSKKGIENPLGGGANQTITDVLKNVINWMLGLVGIVALIALITGGFRMIVDFGNEEQVKKAKLTILWAVIGLAVVILSYAIINIVVSDILGGNTPTETSYGEPTR